MALGVLLGAYLMQKDGWSMVWVAFAVALLGGVVDLFWGRAIGQALGDAVRNYFTQ